jgi:hypothetical protein
VLRMQGSTMGTSIRKPPQRVLGQVELTPGGVCPAVGRTSPSCG